MKKTKVISLILAAMMMVVLLSGFSKAGTVSAADNSASSNATTTASSAATTTGTDVTPESVDQYYYTDQMWLAPIDVDYTLDCYNLARRYYWLMGQYEEAEKLKCPVEKPQRYITLMLDGVGVVASFAIDGKATGLGSYLPPESEYYDVITKGDAGLTDLQGCYMGVKEGIFFFTPDGNCIEWNGKYLYSDIEFTVENNQLLTQKAPAKGTK